MIFNIVCLLFFFLLGIRLSSVQLQNQVENCLFPLLVRNFYDPNNYLVVCNECKMNYVLSFDLQKCIDSSIFKNSALVYCKRLGRDDQCEEGQCGIQINQQGVLTRKSDGYTDENCAQYDELHNCSYPRLNYVLNLDNQQIYKETVNYCSIIQNGVCIKYHSSFIPTSSGYSALIPGFKNAEKIDNIQSSDQIIKCLQGYESKFIVENNQQSGKYYGCSILPFDIQHCVEYDQYTRLCLKCEQGYSLNQQTKKECLLVTNCLLHSYSALNEVVCLQCQQFNYLKYGKCYYLEHCAVQGDDGYCAYCNYPYYGKYCQLTNEYIVPECEWLNRDGFCAKCIKNDIQFYHIYQQKCQERKFSINCKNKNYISDQCDDIQCIEGYYFDSSNFRLYFKDFQYSKEFSCPFLSNAKELFNNYYRNEDYLLKKNLKDFYYQNNVIDTIQSVSYSFCIQRTLSTQNCAQLDDCFDSCRQCDKDYQQQYSNLYIYDINYRYYSSICVSKDKALSYIQNCIEYGGFDFRSCNMCEDYYQNQQYYCQIGQIPHCQKYNYDKCYQCEQGYTLFQNKCEYSEYCNELQLDGQVFKFLSCIQKPNVQIALYKSSDGSRQECILNPIINPCSIYSDNICQGCSQDYALIQNQNRCDIANTENCFLADENQICIYCKNGYKLIKGKCVQINGSCSLSYLCSDSFCELMCRGVSNNNCKYECPSGQVIKLGKCQSCTEVYGQGCKQCSYQERCFECYPGYVLDKDRNCKFVCSNQQLVNQPSECVACPSNCHLCSSLEKCDVCKNGYFLQNGVCLSQCQNQITYDTRDEFGKECYSCNQNCNKCNNNSYCLKCKDGWLNDNGKCVEACAYFSIRGLCINKCIGYLLQDKSCAENCTLFSIKRIEKDLNQVFQLNTYCIERCDDYKFEDSNECAPSCPRGYYQNENLKLCQKCQVNNCFSCNKGSTTCQVCKSGYTVFQNQCWVYCPYSSQYALNSQDCPQPDPSEQCLQQNRGCQKCKSIQKYECEKCLENFISFRDIWCQCPYDQGFYQNQIGQCVKCQIKNCENCQENRCSKCKYGLVVMRTYGEDQPQDECVGTCPEGYFQNYSMYDKGEYAIEDNFCLQCNNNCLSCTSQVNCNKCKEGYTLVKIIDSFTNSVYNQCYYKCPDGSKQQIPQLCACADQNCNSCEQDPYKCSQCKDGYQLNGNICSSVQSLCQIPNCNTCNQSGKECIKCVQGFLLYNNQCKYYCQNGQLANDPAGCDTYNLCFVNDCYFCSSVNPFECLSCNWPLNLYNKSFCSQGCPEGYYLSENSRVCLKCDIQCKTCEKANICTSCQQADLLSSNCYCKEGYFLYQNKCVEKCPFYSNRVNGLCLSYCVDGLYPYYTSNLEQRLCESVVDDINNSFCMQNIINIPDLISFSMDKNTVIEGYYIINIKLWQTPHQCYTFVVKGKDGNTFSIELNQINNDNIIYRVLIPKSALDSQISCVNLSCQISLEVYYIGKIQYTFYTNVGFNVNLIVTNGINFSGDQTTQLVACTDCLIPQSLVIGSNVMIKCPSGQSCTQDNIYTTTNSQISITQAISDARFLNNKLYPQSLKLTFIKPDGSTQILYIKNYLYDNSKLGQITYTFYAIGFSGILTITSFCNSANYIPNQRLLIQSTTPSNLNSGVVYPQFEIKLNIKGQEENAQSLPEANNNSSENGMTNIIIIVSVVSSIVILLLVFIIYKLLKRKQNKQKKYQEQAQIEQNNVENVIINADQQAINKPEKTVNEDIEQLM